MSPPGRPHNNPCASTLSQPAQQKLGQQWLHQPKQFWLQCSQFQWSHEDVWLSPMGMSPSSADNGRAGSTWVCSRFGVSLSLAIPMASHRASTKQLEITETTDKQHLIRLFFKTFFSPEKTKRRGEFVFPVHVKGICQHVAGKAMLVAWRSHHLMTLGTKRSQEVAGREASHSDTCTGAQAGAGSSCQDCSSLNLGAGKRQDGVARPGSSLSAARV